MKFNFTKHFMICFISIPIILLISLIKINHTLDIQLHDTYFVIANLHLGMLFSLLMGIYGFLYYQFRRRKLNKWLTLFHLIFTLLFIVTSLFSNYINGSLNAYLFLLCSFILSQCLFLINLVIGLIKK